MIKRAARARSGTRARMQNARPGRAFCIGSRWRGSPPPASDFAQACSELPRAVVLKPPSTYMISPVMPLVPKGVRPIAAHDVAAALIAATIAQRPGVHGYGAGHGCDLPGSEPRDLRGHRFHSASPASVSGIRSAGHDLQHLSESGSRARRLLVDELLRAARQHPGLLEPFHLSVWQRSRRRDWLDPAGKGHAYFSGLFRDAWRWPGDGAQLRRGGDDNSD